MGRGLTGCGVGMDALGFPNHKNWESIKCMDNGIKLDWIKSYFSQTITQFKYCSCIHIAAGVTSIDGIWQSRYVQETSSPEPFLVIQTVSPRINGDESGDYEDDFKRTSVIITYTLNFDKCHKCPVKFVKHLFIHNIQITKLVVTEFSF